MLCSEDLRAGRGKDMLLGSGEGYFKEEAGVEKDLKREYRLEKEANMSKK